MRDYKIERDSNKVAFAVLLSFSGPGRKGVRVCWSCDRLRKGVPVRLVEWTWVFDACRAHMAVCRMGLSLNLLNVCVIFRKDIVFFLFESWAK